MGKALDDLAESYRPTIEAASYVDRATTYVTNKLGDSEGTEVIVAAMIVAQAIRASSHDLVNAMKEIEQSIDMKDTLGIEGVLEKLEATLYDAAQRI